MEEESKGVVGDGEEYVDGLGGELVLALDTASMETA